MSIKEIVKQSYMFNSEMKWKGDLSFPTKLYCRKSIVLLKEFKQLLTLQHPSIVLVYSFQECIAYG